MEHVGTHGTLFGAEHFFGAHGTLFAAEHFLRGFGTSWKVLGSMHRVNKGGDRAVLGGPDSFAENKATKKRAKIHYEASQGALHHWAPAAAQEVNKVKGQTEAASNRCAILAMDGESGSTRPARA